MTPVASSAEDDFNRADGSLGPNWTTDPVFGTGAAVIGNQIASPPSGGGAFFWTAHGFGADQFSQVRITGAIGDFTGVAVRVEATPSQGYWLAVKGDGAYLYAFVGGVFHQLVHDATGWATGDTLRLEVQTVATNTARLTVHRNGSPLFTARRRQPLHRERSAGHRTVRRRRHLAGRLAGRRHQHRSRQLRSGQWPPRPEVGRGSAPGATAPRSTGNQVVSPLSNGGALFWGAQGFERRPVLADPDHRRHRGLGRSVGPGKIVPAQGYWLAAQG